MTEPTPRWRVEEIRQHMEDGTWHNQPIEWLADAICTLLEAIEQARREERAEQAARDLAADLVDRVFGLKPPGMRGSAQEQEVIAALLSIAEQARREEREACALIAQALNDPNQDDQGTWSVAAYVIQQRIRARAQE